MRLTYINMNLSFDLEFSKLNSIVIEDSGLFMDFTMEILAHIKKEKESFILNLENKTIDLCKIADAITSPLELVYDKRGVQKRLYEDIMNTMTLSGIDMKISGILGDLVDVLEDIGLQTDYDIEFSGNFGVSDILKFFNVEFKEPSGSFSERFMEYALNVKKFSGKNLFFLINCDAYIKNEEYYYIEKWAESYEVFVVFIKNLQIDCEIDYNEYIIDKEQCFLH